MKTIKQTYTVKVPIERVWKALVDPKEIERWNAGPAKMDDKVGTKFKLWGGDIYGENTEVVKNRKLVQDWYGGDWPEPSKVTITLSTENEITKIDLLHDNIPDEEVGNIADGWNLYYFGELKKLLEK